MLTLPADPSSSTVQKYFFCIHGLCATSEIDVKHNGQGAVAYHEWVKDKIKRRLLRHGDLQWYP